MPEQTTNEEKNIKEDFNDKEREEATGNGPTYAGLDLDYQTNESGQVIRSKDDDGQNLE
jgi:hypothetical protein